MTEIDRGKRKLREGVVISDKMNKTIVVGVVRFAKDKRYKKIVKHFKKFKVHDEKEEASVNDKVLIVETRPISKEKRWRLVKVLK